MDEITPIDRDALNKEIAAWVGFTQHEGEYWPAEYTKSYGIHWHDQNKNTYSFPPDFCSSIQTHIEWTIPKLPHLDMEKNENNRWTAVITKVGNEYTTKTYRASVRNSLPIALSLAIRGYIKGENFEADRSEGK